MNDDKLIGEWREEFEAWINRHPHLRAGNSFQVVYENYKIAFPNGEYCSSWMQSTFEAYRELKKENESLTRNNTAISEQRFDLIGENAKLKKLVSSSRRGWLKGYLGEIREDEVEELETSEQESREIKLEFIIHKMFELHEAILEMPFSNFIPQRIGEIFVHLYNEAEVRININDLVGLKVELNDSEEDGEE
jgi:hypothetical protein